MYVYSMFYNYFYKKFKQTKPYSDGLKEETAASCSAERPAWNNIRKNKQIYIYI